MGMALDAYIVYGINIGGGSESPFKGKLEDLLGGVVDLWDICRDSNVDYHCSGHCEYELEFIIGEALLDAYYGPVDFDVYKLEEMIDRDIAARVAAFAAKYEIDESMKFWLVPSYG
jgi:hypothetical protein